MNRSFRAQESLLLDSAERQRQQLRASMKAEKDEELSLFLEMRRREKEQDSLLLSNPDEFETPLGSKPGTSPVFNISSSAPVRKTATQDDFLNSEGDKNDYEWRITRKPKLLFRIGMQSFMSELSDSRKCLLDFVKEDNLKKAVENCGSSHRQFENKIAQFQQMFVEVKGKVEELFACRASLSVKNLEVAVTDHERFIIEQKSIMQSLSKDVNTVKKLVYDCMSSKLSSSLRPPDAVSALGPMYEVHDKNHLPKMQACYNSISELLDFCKNKKNEMNNFVHSYMQKITYVTYIIKDAKLQFPVFKEAMVRQDDLIVF